MTPNIDPDGQKIAVIGLGYVGLPLVLEFGKSLNEAVIGFDTNEEKVLGLQQGRDLDGIVTNSDLQKVNVIFTSDQTQLQDVDCFIVAVPTPISDFKKPDLGHLLAASRIVGTNLSKGNVVIFESTVYPGATEDECVPVLEHFSKLKFNKDFFCGYSPERVNPGDEIHTLKKITKVTSGSTSETSIYVRELYRKIITAGVYEAKSIKVAEAAKVIENTQRDLNIALINEVAIICDLLNLRTKDVIDAASTKWNFMPFQPGLVGGHCIGVDPYYLTAKAETLGYHPELILAGRRLNDEMGKHVANRMAKALSRAQLLNGCTNVLILGLAFKENCADIRNSKVFDVINELNEFGINADVWDPLVESIHGSEIEGINLLKKPVANRYQGIIVAVPHKVFIELGLAEIQKFLKCNGIIFDIKSAFPDKDHCFSL